MVGGEAGQSGKDQAQGTPALEWTAAGIGAVLTLGLLGFLGWEAYERPGGTPPVIEVSLRDVVPAGKGYVAEITARNLSSETAAGVDIEGVLSRGGQEVEQAQATLDYVPGQSERRGGLFFSEDPSEGDLELRALGYAEP